MRLRSRGHCRVHGTSLKHGGEGPAGSCLCWGSDLPPLGKTRATIQWNLRVDEKSVSA